MEIVMKCKTCGEEYEDLKLYFDKHKTTRSGFNTECKICVSKRRKIHYINNREKIIKDRKEYKIKNREKVLKCQRDYSKNNKEKRRASHIRCEYKVEEIYIQELMNIQSGCCEICGQSLVYPNSRRSYDIDHNHKTGEVRSLLCSKCNTAIGLLQEDITIAESIVKYLKKYHG